MISMHHWNKHAHVSETVAAENLRGRRDALLADDAMLWLDLDHPTVDEETLVFRDLFPVHALTLEDITRLRREPDSPPHFPKVEEFSDYLFVVVNPLTGRFLESIQKTDPKGVAIEHASTQLSAVITHNVLLTHHYDTLASVDDLRSFLSRHNSDTHRGPDYLFHLILDSMVDQYALGLDHFDDSIESIEATVIEQPIPATLQALLELKRHIIMLRKTLVYEREVLARLSRGEFRLIDEREMAYYRNVYDHLVRFTERIETSREMVSDLMQMHLAATSNKLNEIMKVLTMISTVVLPMTLIAGIYGMNFKNQPEYEWRLGYPYALGVMALTGIGSFALFRWKKWL